MPMLNNVTDRKLKSAEKYMKWNQLNWKISVPSQFVALVAMIRTFLWAYNHANGGSTTVPLLASTPLNSHPHHHSEKQYMIPSHTHALTPSPQPPAPPFRNTTHDPPTSPLTLPHPNPFPTATYNVYVMSHQWRRLSSSHVAFNGIRHGTGDPYSWQYSQ